MTGGRQRLLTQLRDALVDTWRRGWQPADLHRLGRRHLEAGALALLGDAVVDELGRYAPATVDHRWREQLTDLELGGWWPEGSDYLAARLAGEDDWRQVERDGWVVVRFLSSLPRLERLGPLPGEATAADAAPSGADGQADERVLAKVRALLAKAESTTFDAEAEAFTAAAQKLMARHSIDAAMLAASGASRSGGPQGVRLGVERPYESPKAMLLTAVAEANRCRTVWSQPLGFATVVGFAPDLRAVETLFTSLLVQATAAMQAEGSRRTAWGQSRTRSFRQSFLTAYAVRIGERLTEVTRSEVAAASGQPAGGQAWDPFEQADAEARVASGEGGAPTVHGQQLVPVLAERTREVEEATDALFPRVTRKASRLPSDAEGWWSGRDAADRARLTGPAALGRSASR